MKYASITHINELTKNPEKKLQSCWVCKCKGITDLDIEKAFALAIEKGAEKYCGVDIVTVDSREFIEMCAPEDFEYFGVDYKKRTYFADSISSFGLEAIELNRDQVRGLI